MNFWKIKVSLPIWKKKVFFFTYITYNVISYVLIKSKRLSIKSEGFWYTKSIKYFKLTRLKLIIPLAFRNKKTVEYQSCTLNNTNIGCLKLWHFYWFFLTFKISRVTNKLSIPLRVREFTEFNCICYNVKYRLEPASLYINNW